MNRKLYWYQKHLRKSSLIHHIFGIKLDEIYIVFMVTIMVTFSSSIGQVLIMDLTTLLLQTHTLWVEYIFLYLIHS